MKFCRVALLQPAQVLSDSLSIQQLPPPSPFFPLPMEPSCMSPPRPTSTPAVLTPERPQDNSWASNLELLTFVATSSGGSSPSLERDVTTPPAFGALATHSRPGLSLPGLKRRRLQVALDADNDDAFDPSTAADAALFVSSLTPTRPPSSAASFLPVAAAPAPTPTDLVSPRSKGASPRRRGGASSTTPSRSRGAAVVFKGAWMPEEDAQLGKLVKQFGATKWRQIASHMAGRVAKQCRERWHHHLAPGVKKSGWTKDEDALILRLQSEHGNKWAFISRHLPGRTDNAVKNRFNSSLRRIANGGTLSAKRS